jgi:hydroxyacylglutathione hydrolase
MGLTPSEIAPGVVWLPLVPPYAINAYLVDDVLIDAGMRAHRGLLLRWLRGRSLAAHALTHVHPDHQGATHAICESFGVPLLCGEHDCDVMQRGATSELLPPSLMNRVVDRLFSGPAHPVARALREGDAVAGFTVIETPGHTPGHVSFWRAADGVLVLGDVLANCHPLTQAVGLREPLPRFTADVARNRDSARRIADLRPRLVLFGHGPPLRDPDRLSAFVESLA